MELPLFMIVLGILLWAVVSSALGFACILIGIVLALWPRLRRGAR